VAIELVDGRPVLVGDDEIAVPGVDDQPFRIEAAAEQCGVAVQEARIQPVQRPRLVERRIGRAGEQPVRVGELDRLLERRDRSD
jgi:hypothetical protein